MDDGAVHGLRETAVFAVRDVEGCLPVQAVWAEFMTRPASWCGWL